MGPSTESLALADLLISKLGLQVDRISLAYAIMGHVEIEYSEELSYEDRIADLEAALAARQPAGISVGWVLGYLTTDAPEESREAIRNAFDEYAALSDNRQPVGQEPVAWYWPFSGAVCSADAVSRDRAPTDNAVPLYAAPPAQAVDLDELRRAACVVGVVGQIDGHDVVRRNSVLDVIDTRRQRLTDSQAVGNAAG